MVHSPPMVKSLGRADWAGLALSAALTPAAVAPADAAASSVWRVSSFTTVGLRAEAEALFPEGAFPFFFEAFTGLAALSFLALAFLGVAVGGWRALSDDAEADGDDVDWTVSPEPDIL